MPASSSVSASASRWRRRSRGRVGSGLERVAAGVGRIVHVRERVADVAQAAARVLLEALAQQPAQPLRSRRRQHVPSSVGRQDRRERVGGRVPVEGSTTREHLEQQAAECPDVGPLVHGKAARLLGRHVGRRAEDSSRPCDRRLERRRLRAGCRSGLAVGRAGLRQPEVEDLDPAVRRQLDVGGLEIAVDDAFFVRLVERLRDLPGDRERLALRDRAALETAGEVLAFDELHRKHVCGLAGRRSRLLEAVHMGDVGMVERGEQLRFFSKRASRSGSLETAAGSSLRATARSSLESRARYTSPIPPTPSRASIVYGPRRTPGARLTARAPKQGETGAILQEPGRAPTGVAGRAPRGCAGRTRRLSSLVQRPGE